MAFKDKLLVWAGQFDEFVWLDSNNYPQRYSNFDAVLAVGAKTEIQCTFHNAFAQLKHFKNTHRDYIFGYLAYDLKNDIEKLGSHNFDGLHFPDLYFFQPKKLFLFKNGMVEIKYLLEYEADIQKDLEHIKKMDTSRKTAPIETQDTPQYLGPHHVKIKKRISKKQYLEQLGKILEHIHRGDIYEVNFCQEFYAKDAIIDPLEVYYHLNRISNPPFAGFIKLKDKYVISASPERFVKKTGNKVISQPIKAPPKD